MPVRAALKTNPAILHFATHIVAQKDEFQSGVIALSLDSDGVMGLLGPREIVARGVRPKLVVMNGCHLFMIVNAASVQAAVRISV